MEVTVNKYSGQNLLELYQEDVNPLKNQIKNITQKIMIVKEKEQKVLKNLKIQKVFMKLVHKHLSHLERIRKKILTQQKYLTRIIIILN